MTIEVPWGKEQPRLTIPADHDALWVYNFRHPCIVLDMGVMQFADERGEKIANNLMVQFPYPCQIKIRGRDGATNAIMNALALYNPERFCEWSAFISYLSSDFFFEKDYLYAFFSREIDRNIFYTLVSAAIEADNA